VIDPAQSGELMVDPAQQLTPSLHLDIESMDPSGGFRDRLNAVDLR
jgi:hypothetical protein